MPQSDRSSADSTGLGINLPIGSSPKVTSTQTQRFARPHIQHAHSSSVGSIPRIPMPIPSTSTAPRSALRRPKSQSSLGTRYPVPGELFYGNPTGSHRQPSVEESPILPWRQPSFRQGLQQGYQRIASCGTGSPRNMMDNQGNEETLAGPRYEQQEGQVSASSITAPVPRPRRDRQPTTHPSPGDLMTPAWERRGSVWSPPTPCTDRMPTPNRNLPSRLSRGANQPWSSAHLSPAVAAVGGSYQDKRRSYGPGIAVQSAVGSPYNNTTLGNDNLGSIKTTGSANFPMRPEGRKRALSEGECQLHREGTLLTAHATSKRASAELGIMLGNSSRKASKSKLLPQGELPVEEKMAKLDKVKLEARKGGKAKVEVDVILENDEVVEGGEIRGRLEVRVRKAKRSEKVWIGSGKIRIVGYEEHSNTSARHIFYHYPYTLPAFTPYATEEEYHNPLFASAPDDVGYRQAAEGNWVIPFSMRLPVDGGAKGGWSLGVGKPGVKYVVVGSIKLHTPESKKRAIAHFYRPCIVYPQLDPTSTLAPSEAPRAAEAEGGLGWSLAGQKGKVILRAKLQRDNWVAGQKVWIGVEAENMSSRKVKSFNVALMRTITIYTAPSAKVKTIDAWASPDLSLYKPHKITKKLWEEVVEASAGNTSGYLGSASWWTGVEPGAKGAWQSHLTIPAECVTVTRSRLLDVSYSIRVTLNSAVHVDLPLTVVNFLSLDPPPGSFEQVTEFATRPNGQALLSGPTSLEGRAATLEQEAAVRQPKASDWAYGPQPLLSGSSTVSEQFSFPQPKIGKPSARPMSLQSAMRDPFGLHQGRSAEDLSLQPSRPASLSRSASTPSMDIRPSSARRRDTATSYLSAVESSDDDHDMAMIEARRRAGRQQSLAAIMGNRIGDTLDEEDEEEMPTPPSETFAPFNQRTSPALRDSTIEEVRNDLEFVRAEEEGMAVAEEEYERDSESRCLEHDLQGSGTYRRRMGSTAGISVADQSVSEYPTTEAHATPVMPSQVQEERSAENIPPSRPSSVDRLDRFVPMDRSRMYGSIAASVMTMESEVGQVVQAFRRDLSMRERRPSEAPLRKVSDTLHAPQGPPPAMNRMPFTSTYLAVPRASSLTVTHTSQPMAARSYSLDTAQNQTQDDTYLVVPGMFPRTNSDNPPLSHRAYRRPSGTAFQYEPPGASPKTMSGPLLRSPAAHALFGHSQPIYNVRHPAPVPISPKSYATIPAPLFETRRPSSPLVRRTHSPIPEGRVVGLSVATAAPGLSPSEVGDSSSSHDSHGSQCESPVLEESEIRVGADHEEEMPHYANPMSRHGSAFELDDRSTYTRTPTTPKSPYSQTDRFGSMTRLSPSGPRSRNGSSPKVVPDKATQFPLPPLRNGEGRTTYTAIFDARQRGERPDIKVGYRRASNAPPTGGGLGRASSRASNMSTSTTATMAELALLHHAITTGHMDAPSLRRTAGSRGVDDARDLL